MRVVISAACVFLLLACSEPSEVAPPARSAPSPPPPAAEGIQPRQLVTSASLSLESADPQALKRYAEGLASSHGGYLESLESAQWHTGPYFALVLRVSSEHLDSVVESLKAEATNVTSESRSTEDVTSKVVDMDARTRALRLTEEQLEELLTESRSAHRGAEEIMAIFRELTSVREEREQIQGQLASLQDLVALSKVSVQIRPLHSATRRSIEWGVDETVLNAVDLLLLSVRGLLRLLIYLLVVGLPLCLVLVPLVKVVMAARRRLNRSK